MIKIIYNCMVLVLLMIPQEVNAKEEINTSKQKILEYRIQEMDKKIDNLTRENKSLSSSITTLTAEIDTTISNLNNNSHVYDTVLNSTKDSYSFLEQMFIYAIGFVFFLVIGSSWVVKILTSNNARNILSEKLNQMTGEGLAIEIEEWIKKENKNLKIKLESFEKKYTISPSEHKVINEFTIIINKDYSRINNDIQPIYSIEEYIALAKKCLNVNAHIDVKNTLTEALQEYTSDSKIYILLGTINLYDGSYEIAEKYLDKAREIEPSNFYIYHLLASLHMYKNETVIAMNNFENAIELGSTIVDDYLHLGEKYLANNDIIRLEKIYNQAALLFPSDVRIYIILGHVYYTLSNYGHTKEMIKKIQYLHDKEKF